MSTIRLLPLESASGATNMAADEALLESAASGIATLRFYTWSEPTLSLGYFQPAADRHLVPGLADLSWVRRASGGSALVHDLELTYALALPAGPPWQRRGASWVCTMHAVIAGALAEFGIRVQTCACGEERKLGPVLCFLHHTPGDLILNGHKIAGSAQRKQRGGLVQHGGILLGQSPHTPSLPGVSELFGVSISNDDLVAAILSSFLRDTGFDLVAGDWTEAERERTCELATSKYGSEGWNKKR